MLFKIFPASELLSIDHPPPFLRPVVDVIERTNLGLLSLLDEVSLRRTAPAKPGDSEASGGGGFPFLGVSSSSEGDATPPPTSGDLFLDRLVEAFSRGGGGKHHHHQCLQFREQKNQIKESNGIPQHCFK